MATAMDYAALYATKAQLKKGTNAEQKTAINYFLPNKGCIGLLTKVKDEKYDEIVKNLVDNSNSYQKALNKIGLDESELKEIPPVTLYGYEESSYSQTTKTGEYRSNLYAITHLFFSSTEVYMYKLVLNTMNNEKKERTEEYFYKDITNFSTADETIETWRFKGCSIMPTKSSVNIRRFALIVPGDKFSCSTLGDIDQQISAMKNKLREKKL